MNTVAILEVSLLLAFIAICVSRPRHPIVTSSGPASVASERLDATLRLRRLDQSDATEATPVSVRIAPVHDEAAALQVLWVGETMLADLEPSDIVTVRAWSQRQLVCSFGEVRFNFGPWQPASRFAAGWEIFLVTRTGRMLHLQGRPGRAIDAELARLTARMQAARVADAA